jgi:Ser/Thr protein kinase RdoA (MazF antagonist)
VEPILLSLACNLYNTSPEELTPLSGGHDNAVYQFPQGDKFAILRIRVEESPRQQTLGMLEWVHFLSLNGAPVSAPLPSINNHLLESLKHYGKSYIINAFEKVEGNLAENIPPSHWSKDLYHSIGKAVGMFHCISSRYKAFHPAHTRPQWYGTNEIHKTIEKLTDKSDPAGGKLARLIIELQRLPTTCTDFGLIHGDLHFANFIIQPGGTVTIFDFDDCVHGWFAMDIAMALFDVLVLYSSNNQGDNQRFTREFLSYYLSGYRQEYELSQFWQNQIPQFLKLLELCNYANLIGHPDVALPDTWVGRFMRNRYTRIANDIPYVDIDFSSI